MLRACKAQLFNCASYFGFTPGLGIENPPKQGDPHGWNNRSFSNITWIPTSRMCSISGPESKSLLPTCHVRPRGSQSIQMIGNRIQASAALSFWRGYLQKSAVVPSYAILVVINTFCNLNPSWAELLIFANVCDNVYAIATAFVPKPQ